MTLQEGPFEVDRGSGGKIRINVVSVANLIALIGLIGTAVATWNGLTNKVDILSIKVESATQLAAQLRGDMTATIIARGLSEGGEYRQSPDGSRNGSAADGTPTRN